jgi:hypothetical protein
MNGRGTGGGGGGEDEMEEDNGPSCAQGAGARNKERVVLMWGYLPGVSPQRSPLLGPVPVKLSSTAATPPVMGGETCAAAVVASRWPSLVAYPVLFLIVVVLIL